MAHKLAVFDFGRIFFVLAHTLCICTIPTYGVYRLYDNHLECPNFFKYSKGREGG